MKSRELRALARADLKGKWGKAVTLTIIYLITTMIISYIFALIPILGQIMSLLISPILSFGILASYIKLARNQEVTYFQFFNEGLENFQKVWGIILHTFLKMIVPLLFLLSIPIILAVSNFTDMRILSLIALMIYPIAFIYLLIKTFSYLLTSYILCDEPDLTSKEIVEKSEELMRGNKWRYFFLSLSFFGWILLSIVTYLIAYFWILPYIQITYLKFYEELSGSITSAEPTSPINDDN